MFRNSQQKNNLSLFIYFLISTWCIVVPLSLEAQSKLSSRSKKAKLWYTEADNHRVRGELDQAVDFLKQAIRRDKKFEEAYYLLGRIYQMMNKFSLATTTFQKGHTIAPPDKKPKYAYSLGEIYLKKGSYDSAQFFLKDGLHQKSSFSKTQLKQIQVWYEQTEYGLAHNATAYNYQVAPLPDSVNVYPMQYFPTLTADNKKLIFTIRYGMGFHDDEDLVISYNDNGAWSSPKRMTQLNSSYREGASTLSADGRILIFTLCQTSGCDLYESKKNGHQWSKPVKLGAAINTKGWEAQPALSADGNQLYFVSDRAQGTGGYDIWFSKKNQNGTWSKAVNAGSINTPFDEMAPYLHANGITLYFASNGLPGFGGYDIYKAEKTSTDWTQPINMGKPINDHHDQYSFAVTADGTRAYFSREERSRSLIFQTTIPKPMQDRSRIVVGKVREKGSQAPLKAYLNLFDMNQRKKISTFQSDSLTGKYLIVIPKSGQYAMHASCPNYLFESTHFEYVDKDHHQPVTINIELQPLEIKPSIVLNNIFFAVNSYQLTEASKLEIQEVADFLSRYPQIRVQIAGHTDDVGSAEYNMILSSQRAYTVRDYLIFLGVPAYRMEAKGYGDKRPIEKGKTDQSRQRNRRIEFIIK